MFELSLKEKLGLAGVGVLFVSWLVLVTYLSSGTTEPKRVLHWGDSVVIKSGFYKGFEGYLVKDNGNGSYTVSSVYTGGFLPVQVEAVVNQSEFDVVVDTATGK